MILCVLLSGEGQRKERISRAEAELHAGVPEGARITTAKTQTNPHSKTFAKLYHAICFLRHYNTYKEALPLSKQAPQKKDTDIELILL